MSVAKEVVMAVNQEIYNKTVEHLQAEIDTLKSENEQLRHTIKAMQEGMKWAREFEQYKQERALNAETNADEH